jgi:hypothetical protein
VQRRLGGSLPQALGSGGGKEAQEHHLPPELLQVECPAVQPRSRAPASISP